jgi:hypothetical protein
MMLGLKTVFIFICILLPGLAFADIYYWIDPQGTQYYTTRPESIPEPYRSKALLLSLPTSPPAPPEMERSLPQKVPIQISFTPGSPVLVSARINGAGPITLILDTGSERTLVAPSVLRKLGISTEHTPRGIIKGVTGISYADAVWVHSVEVGEAKAGPFLIIAHDADLKEADGLLGRDFLSNFNVTINSKERVVTLTPD